MTYRALRRVHARCVVIAALLATLLATPGTAARAQGVDADLRLGETFAGAIDLPGDLDVVRFAALSGETVTLLVAGSKKTGIVPHVDLVRVDGAQDDTVLLGQEPTGKAPKVAIKKLVLTDAGIYELRISGADGTTGTYKVKTKGGKPTTKSEAPDDVVTAGNTLDVTFTAKAGSTLRADAKASKGSLAVVGEITLVHATKGAVDLTGLVAAKGKKTIVGDVILPWFGSYTLSVVNNGPDGTFDAKAIVKAKFKKRQWIEFAFGGELVVTPDVIVNGENEGSPITALIGLPDLDKPPVDVALVRDVDGTAASSVAMVDDGDLSQGDEIGGDRVFSVRVAPSDLPDGYHDFVVLVNVKKKLWARSEPVTVIRTEPLDDAEIDAIVAMQTSYEAQIEQAVLDETLDAVLAQILAELQADPLVDDVGMTDGDQGIWIVYACGIPGLLYSPDAETKGPGGVAGQQGAPPRIVTAGGVAEYPGGRTVPYPAYDAYVPGLKDIAQTPTSTGQGNGDVGTYLAAMKAGADPNVVGSNKVRAIAAQYYEWGENDDIPQIVQKLKDNGCFEVEYSQGLAKYGGSIEWFKNLGDYGIVLISTHGDSAFQNIAKKWKAVFKYAGKGSQVVLYSNQKLDNAAVQANNADFFQGRLVYWGSVIGIMPSFITKHAGKMPGSLVYTSACRSTFDFSMANAFLKSGAKAYVGYDDYVAVSFCISHGVPMFDTLLEEDKDLGDAYELDIEPFTVNGKVDKFPAVFEMFGSTALKLDPRRLQDGGFESGNEAGAWTAMGDARVIPSLKGWTPTEGNRMAIISTGLGFTTLSGSLSQVLCLPDDATAIEWTWSFFSEEFLEFCGSIFQDTFQVSIQQLDENGADVGAPVILQNTKVDDLCGPPSTNNQGQTVYKNPDVFLTVLHFDQGENGDVYANGWTDTKAPIPEAMKGQKVRLTFEAFDVGDSIYDTAILIDEIKLLK